MMLSELPPDIRSEALLSEEHHHGEGEVDMHETPYTDELIIRAIREGLDLTPTVRRWSWICRGGVSPTRTRRTYLTI